MGRLPHWLPLPLLIVLILALGLRLPFLSGSLWLDEAAQVLESARPFSQQLEIIPDFQPPLFHYLVHFSLYLGNAEWWLRLIGAIIPGLITIWAAYQIGKRLHSPATGILAALLLTTSSFHIFYSQELRPYALPAMLATFSWWWILKSEAAIKTKELAGSFWVGWAILSLFGWYSSYLYPFLWFSQVAFLAIYYRHQWRSLLMTIGSLVVGFGIWLPIFRQQLAAGQELRVVLPGWQEVVSFSQLKTVPLVMAKFLFGVVNVELNVFFVVSSLAVILLTGWLLLPYLPKLGNQGRLNPKVGLVIIWLVVPLTIAWLISFVVPIIQPKRVLFLLPAFYLALAWLITTTRYKLARIGLVTLLLTLNLWGTVQYYSNPLYQRENWRALQQTIFEHYPVTQSLVIFAFPEPFAPWRWYDKGLYKTLSLGYINSETELQARQEIGNATQFTYLVTFDYLGDLSDPENVIEDELESLGYQTLEIIDYPNIGFVRIWARQGVTVSQSSGTIESHL